MNYEREQQDKAWKAQKAKNRAWNLDHIADIGKLVRPQKEIMGIPKKGLVFQRKK